MFLFFFFNRFHLLYQVITSLLSILRSTLVNVSQYCINSCFYLYNQSIQFLHLNIPINIIITFQ